MREAYNPVFVVGMNGSGTSMMLDSLGRHPGLYAVPHETLMMPYIIGRAARFGDLADDGNFRAYWQYAIDQMPVLLKMNGSVKPRLPADWRTYPRNAAGVFDGIFSSFAERQGKRRWCEKTPDHVQHLPLLAETFPNARFLHLIRDGREVSCSINRRQFRRPELVIYRWKMLVRAGQRAGRELGERYMELKYEDLTSDPRSAMARICDFAGLEFSESVLVSRMPQSPKRKSLQAGSLGQISSNPQKWPTYFDEQTLRRLEAIGGGMLRSLAYEVRYEAGDGDPGAVKRRIWRLTDFLRLTARRLRTRSELRSRTSLLRHLVFSLKQYRSKHH